MVEIVLPKVEYPPPPLWADPKLWLVIAIIIAIIVIILIYFRIFTGDHTSGE